MIRHADSHVDHDLTEEQLRYVLDCFATRDAFFIETITLPAELGTVPCGLYGPVMGDSTIREDEVTYARRGERAWGSRLVDLPPRQQHEVTVIAGPHDGHPCVLFTAFGGPLAPQEPGDVRRQIEDLEKQRRERRARGEEPQIDVVAAEGETLWDAELRARVAADPLYAKIVVLRQKRDEADRFWRDHALAR
jgi:hypothetical protein